MIIYMLSSKRICKLFFSTNLFPKVSVGQKVNTEPPHEKTNKFAYAKTKVQTSFAVTAKLILRGNREADQHLCFRYTVSTMPLLLEFKISRI